MAKMENFGSIVHYIKSSSHDIPLFFAQKKFKKIKIVDGNSWFSGSKKLWAAKLFQLQQR
jgi:hypothetical protein